MMLAGKTRAKAGAVLASMLLGSCLASSCGTDVSQTILEGVQDYLSGAQTPTFNDDAPGCSCQNQEDD